MLKGHSCEPESWAFPPLIRPSATFSPLRGEETRRCFVGCERAFPRASRSSGATSGVNYASGCERVSTRWYAGTNIAPRCLLPAPRRNFFTFRLPGRQDIGNLPRSPKGFYDLPHRIVFVLPAGGFRPGLDHCHER